MKAKSASDTALVSRERSVAASASDVYTRELARIRRIQDQITALEAAADAYLKGSTERLLPLRQQATRWQAELLQQCDTWLQHRGEELSRSQRFTARQRLVEVAQGLAEQGDAAMRALHDRYSPQSLADKQRAAADAVRARLSGWLNEDGDQQACAEHPDALWQAAQQQWRREQADKQAQRAERQARRQERKAAREPDAAATEVEEQGEAGTTLRALYRRLASLCHPDRAADEADRARRHAWMSAANIAHERGDLLALLDLQAQVSEADGAAPAPQRLQALLLLLRQQGANLDRERQHSQQQWRWRLGVPPAVPLAEPALQAHLTAQCDAARLALRQWAELQNRLSDFAGLKAWFSQPVAWPESTPRP